MRAFNAFTCSLPPIAAKAAFRSSSVRFLVASFSFINVACTPMNFPFESNALIPSFSIITPACPAPVVRLAMIAFRAVPPSAPLIPRFASTPKAVEVSSIGTFKPLIVPPTPIIASMSCWAVWLDLLLALQRTSKYPGNSATLTPAALMESVTRSEHCAKSICVASDSFRTGMSASVD